MQTALLERFQAKQCSNLKNITVQAKFPYFYTLLFLNKGRLGRKPVTRGYKLTAPRRTALCHTPALDCKLELALGNPWIRSIIACVGILLPGTMKRGRTRMNLYTLVVFLSTQFIACKRETMTLLYGTENKRTGKGEYKKLWVCFRNHIFSSLFFSTNHRPKNTV